MGSQCYLGTPHGVVLCVDSYAPNHISGTFWHGYREDGISFSNWDQMVQRMEQFFDDIQFPFPSTTFRTFEKTGNEPQHRQEKKKIMADEEVLRHRGELGSFVVRVQHRQNSSWQGRITWIEEDKTVYFRSIWEMIKLVENALDSVGAENESEEVTWGES